MTFGVLDVEFSIGIDQPDRARRDLLAMNVVRHIDGQTRSISERRIDCSGQTAFSYLILSKKQMTYQHECLSCLNARSLASGTR